jgi:hypothetical protein
MQYGLVFYEFRKYLSTSSAKLVGNESALRFFYEQAKKNREIAVLQRKIDEVPSRAELSQYQRRFVELYNQGMRRVQSKRFECAAFTQIP